MQFVLTHCVPKGLGDYHERILHILWGDLTVRMIVLVDMFKQGLIVDDSKTNYFQIFESNKKIVACYFDEYHKLISGSFHHLLEDLGNILKKDLYFHFRTFVTLEANNALFLYLQNNIGEAKDALEKSYQHLTALTRLPKLRKHFANHKADIAYRHQLHSELAALINSKWVAPAPEALPAIPKEFLRENKIVTPVKTKLKPSAPLVLDKPSPTESSQAAQPQILIQSEPPPVLKETTNSVQPNDFQPLDDEGGWKPVETKQREQKASSARKLEHNPRNSNQLLKVLAQKQEQKIKTITPKIKIESLKMPSQAPIRFIPAAIFVPNSSATFVSMVRNLANDLILNLKLKKHLLLLK